MSLGFDDNDSQGELMDTHIWEAIGTAIYFFLYYSVVVMYYVFKAALDHGGTSAAAVVLVVFLVLGLSHRN